MQVRPLHLLPCNSGEIEWLLSDHHFIQVNFGSRPAAVDQSTLPSNITQPGAAGYESQLTGCQIYCLPHAIRARLVRAHSIQPDEFESRGSEAGGGTSQVAWRRLNRVLTRGLLMAFLVTSMDQMGRDSDGL